jgi:hypothetical protein
MSVHLIQTVSIRNGRTFTRTIILPPSQNHSGLTTLIGEYPDIAAAYRAARKKGVPTIYLHCPSDFPVSMRGPNDSHGMSWWE